MLICRILIHFVVFSILVQVNLSVGHAAEWKVTTISEAYGGKHDQFLLSHLRTTDYNLQSRVIRAEGPAVEGDFDKFRVLVQAHPGIKILMVTNMGGHTSQTLPIAETMLTKEMDIWVQEYCWSACAAHLFIAGKHKFLDGLLGLHGNPLALMNFSLLPKDTDSEYRKTLEEFKERFISSGREQREISLLETSGVQQEIFNIAQKGRRRFTIVLGPEALQKYGFSNVEILLDNFEKLVRMRSNWDLQYLE